MGMCSGKCSLYSSPGHKQHLLTCCGQKIIHGWKDSTDTAQLLVFDSAVLASDDKHVVSRDAKSEEEVFGYSIVSQESSRGGSRQGTPKAAADRIFSLGAKDVIMQTTSFPDISFESRNEEKVASISTEPSTSHLNMYIVTWNMNGKALVRSIAKLLDVDGERHDLYVIGLQEAHNSLAESVISEALGEKYSFVSAASMQSLQLFIIARKAVLPFLSRPLVDRISTGGLGGLAGRQKGAVAVTFRFKEASLLFVACHLAPHEGNVGERNAQYHRISQSVFSKQAPVVGMSGGAFSGCSYRNGLIIDDCSLGTEQPLRSHSKIVEKADVVVWMGDLNYRVEMNRNSVTFLIRHKLEEVLWSKDQLTRALKKGQAFIGYQEGSLSFRPTYKYDVGTDNYDTSSKMALEGNERTGWAVHALSRSPISVGSPLTSSAVIRNLAEFRSGYCIGSSVADAHRGTAAESRKLSSDRLTFKGDTVNERVPSWTDRILYKVGDAGRTKVHLKSYNSINSIKSSDHKPVKALMTLRASNSKQEKVKYVH